MKLHVIEYKHYTSTHISKQHKGDMNKEEFTNYVMELQSLVAKCSIYKFNLNRENSIVLVHIYF